MKVLVHYSEIGLKGKNRGFFEKILIDNIKNNLKVKDIEKKDKRIVLDVDKVDNLNNIFGVAYYSIIEEVESNEEDIVKKAISIIKKLKYKEINLRTSRSDKNFPLTSVELNKKIGEEVNKLKLKINFSSDEKIFIEVTKDKSFIYSEKIKGLGGLPVGSSGKVLCLFSGGIDSSLAAYQMMKRGCRVDFLHFHALKNNKDVSKSKIKKIITILNKYQKKSKLYLVPYHNYQLSTMDKFKESLDVVMFKNFMLKFSERICRKGYKAIITGDSLGQVASQTLDNINSSRVNVRIPILSPLISFDKQEIIDLARVIGTYEESIKNYKDCCSIISRKPSTSVKVENVEEVLGKLNFDKLIREGISEMEVV